MEAHQQMFINSIKLSGFGVDITQITRSILCREKLFNLKTFSQVFSTNLTSSSIISTVLFQDKETGNA